MPERNMVEAVREAIDQEMERDKNVIVMGEDVGVDGGVFRCTDGLLKKYGKERVIDTPLAESGIVGTAIGLAIYGMRPIAEVQFSGFLYPAFDQLVSHASRIRWRSRGRFTCPLVVRAPSSGGIRALEHHSESMEALYAHVPGLKMVMPSTPYEAKGLLTAAIRDPDPVLFLEPKRVYRAIKEEVPKKQYTLPFEANVVQEGSDVTVISWGASLRETREAVEELGNAVSAEIIDMRCMTPLDSKTVVDSVKKTGKCVIVHEGPRTCGFGAELIAQINEKCLTSLEAPVERVTGFDTIMPLYKLEREYLPTPKRIMYAIDTVVSY